MCCSNWPRPLWTRNGASERTIMRTTGHTSTQTVRGYIDDAELFTDPASSYLGL
jgi:hypothetical protein